MGVVVVEVIEDDDFTTESVVNTNVTEVISTRGAVEDITGSVQVVDVLRDGGTIVNVGFGEGLPSNPYEGQIWIDIS